MYSSSSANSTISAHGVPRLAPVMPSCARYAYTFSRPVKSGWKPVPICSSAWALPLHLDAAGRGLDHAGHEFEERALAGAVAADDGDLLAAPDVERHAVERRVLACTHRAGRRACRTCRESGSAGSLIRRYTLRQVPRANGTDSALIRARQRLRLRGVGQTAGARTAPLPAAAVRWRA